VLTQCQITEFCSNNQKYLRKDGWATFFLFKVDSEYFVADVGVFSVGMDVYARRFGRDSVWDAESVRRVVIPQLEA
jgi:hypothetical protein